MFEWDDARYFLTVHRTASLSEAGRRLHVNQSTVGRRVRALEEALGQTLFVRTADGYFLSPAGERLLARAERMEDEALALEREASGREASLTGTIRVTGPDALTGRVVVPILAEMHRRTPGLDFEIVAVNRTLSLTKREADLAIRTLRPTEPSLVTRRLCDLGTSLYVSRDYVKEHGLPRSDELATRTFIGMEEPTWQESLWLKRRVPTARVAIKTNSTPTQLCATLAGVGIGMLPCYVGDAEAALVRVVPEVIVMREVWLTLHRDLQHAARIRACADMLIEGFQARAVELAGEARAKPPRKTRPPRAT